MTLRHALRVAGGMLLGIALASLPFLRYAHHARHGASDHATHQAHATATHHP